jgi:hypothetical protein
MLREHAFDSVMGRPLFLSPSRIHPTCLVRFIRLIHN